MDKLEKNLNTDNPLVMAQVFSQIYEAACQPESQNGALEYLKAKCKSDNPLVSETASDVMVQLAQEGRFKLENIIADFNTLLTNCRPRHGAIKVITNLFFLHQKNKYEKSKVLPKVNLNQHPLIKLLKENPDLQIAVFNEIVECFRNNLRWFPLLTRLCEPVYLYTICHPGSNLQYNFIKQNLWNWIVFNDKGSTNSKIIMTIISWLQTGNDSTMHENNLLLIKLLEASPNYLNDTEKELILLKMLSLLYQMLINRENCRATLEALKNVLLKTRLLTVSNVAILLLSKSIWICSPMYLVELLEIGKLLVANMKVAFYSYCSLKFASLLWIANPSVLTQNAKTVLNEILSLETKTQFQTCKSNLLPNLTRQYSHVLQSDPNLALTIHLSLKIEATEDFLCWFSTLELAPVFFLRNIFYALCGLALNKHLECVLHEKLFQLILTCIKSHYDLAFSGLILILHHLSDPFYSQIHYKLLKELPNMACLKENGPKVIATIQALTKQSELNNLAVRLMFAMWRKDQNYYHNLETLINRKKPEVLKEFTLATITDALVLKELCEQCPHLYGKDIVPRLSRILNDCNNQAGAIPCALALEGITALCKSGVIDIATTWATLSKKFASDKRVPVIKSLCLLISTIPELQYTASNEHLNTEVVMHLWPYVTDCEHEEVVMSAYEALSCFNLETVSSNIPDQFLDDNVKDNPNQLKCVSGTTWINLLKNSRFSKATANFLTKLVSKEVGNYLKYVYQVKGQGEPPNYSYLPSHSIVRVLCVYLKKNLDKLSQWHCEADQDRTYVECLYILSRKYCRALPPLDWSFLHELIHEPLLRLNSLEIACHQVIISGSARRFIENFILAYTNEPQIKEVVVLYENLDVLANSIQPVTLKPFIKNTLLYGIEQFDSNPTAIKTLLSKVNAALKNTDVQDINKQSIAEVLQSLLVEENINSMIFSLLLECVINVPSRNQEEFCRFNLSFFETQDFARKSKIRCFLASNMKSDLALNWLNDLIEIGSKYDVRSIIFEDLLEVFKRQIENSQIVYWFLEILGQIQAKITNGCSQMEVNFFCDILILATVSFSGSFVLIPDENKLTERNSLPQLFPQALAILMNENVWSISKPQVLESLHYLNFEGAVDKEYQLIFGQALCALRHDMEFSKNYKWMKYLDCIIEDS